MSHTTTIKDIVFADLTALQAAADDLRDRGIDCNLIENAIPRAYYDNQLGEAPYVLRLNESRYDVGFYQEDGTEGLVPKCDLYANEISRQLGAKQEEGVSREAAAIGKLRNAYAVAATTNQAIQSGATVNRVDNEDGSVQLVIQAA